MALTSGIKLEPYEIISLLGAGGMGEVYRARDARLGRDVALKILPECFAQDAMRLHRFEQEARRDASPFSCESKQVHISNETLSPTRTSPAVRTVP